MPDSRAALAATIDAVERGLVAANLALPQRDVERLAAYLDLLGRWNRVVNLTGIRDLGELVERHVIESLALRPLIRGESIADVGSGAGVPGLPLAVAEPDRAFTLIESRAKRVRFLRQVVLDLGLTNATVAHGRAEHLRPARPFATVLARAVAAPTELLRICRHLTAPGSVLVLLTAAHLRRGFDGLAPDFVPAATAAAASAAAGLRSSIVVLERIESEA